MATVSKERAAEYEQLHQRFDQELREAIVRLEDMPHKAFKKSYPHFVLSNTLKQEREEWERGEAVKILGRVAHEARNGDE